MVPLQIKSPVRGCWSFMNPPGHHPDAKDFVAVDESGKPYRISKAIRHLLFTLPVEDTYAWEQPVFSPFDAKVVGIENSVKDRMTLNLFRDFVNGLLVAQRKESNDICEFLGNYIILKSKEGIFALFAHLREGSVEVQSGTKVIAGEKLAKVGNSGNTIQPHLHFQIMNTNDPENAVPVPFVFDCRQVSHSGAVDFKNSALLRNFQKFRV